MPNVLTLTRGGREGRDRALLDCAAACILQIISLPAKIFLGTSQQ